LAITVSSTYMTRIISQFVDLEISVGDVKGEQKTTESRASKNIDYEAAVFKEFSVEDNLCKIWMTLFEDYLYIKAF